MNTTNKTVLGVSSIVLALCSLPWVPFSLMIGFAGYRNPIKWRIVLSLVVYFAILVIGTTALILRTRAETNAFRSFGIAVTGLCYVSGWLTLCWILLHL